MSTYDGVTMKSKEEIEQEITNIEADPRYSYPDALVEINAPLALIQVAMSAKVGILKWVIS